MRQAIRVPLGAIAAVLAVVGVATGSASGRDDASAADRAIARAWEAFYDDQPAKAAKLAEPVTKLTAGNQEWAAAEAAHIQARCMWEHGTARARDKALEQWKQLGKRSTLRAVKLRLQIVRVLRGVHKAGRKGVPEAGLRPLQAICEKKQANTATCESMLLLARLHAAAGRYDAAGRRLKQVKPFVARTLSVEWPDAIGSAFSAAAQRRLEELALLRDRGRREFEEARALHEKGELVEAARAYRRIARDFADTEYGPRSTLNLGRCLHEGGNVADARKCWEAMVRKSPAGRWRGQAYVELIDLSVIDELDLDQAARYVALAIDLLGKADASDASWTMAARDVHLRDGLLSVMRGRRADAGRSLAVAGQAGASPRDRRRGGLSDLPAMIRSGGALAPETVAPVPPKSPAEAAALACVAYRLIGKPQLSGRMAARMLPRADRPTALRPLPAVPGVGAEQAAFAAFCLSVASPPGKPEQGLRLAELALRMAPKARWQDATLFVLGDLLEAGPRASRTKKPGTRESGGQGDEPEAFGRDGGNRGGGTRPALSKKGPLSQEEKSALRHWRHLGEAFPASPYVPHAMLRVATLLHRSGEFEAAAQVLDRLLEAHSGCPQAPEAAFLLADLSLMKLLDLRLANRAGRAGMQCLKAMESGDREDEARLPATPLWGMPAPVPSEAAIATIRQALLVRMAFVAYVNGERDACVKLLAEARSGQSRRAPGGREESPGVLATLQEVVDDGKEITPKGIGRGSKPAALALRLADLFYLADLNDRAIELSTRALADDRATSVQKSWAYYRRGRAAFCRPYEVRDFAACIGDYLAAQKAHPSASWSPRCLLLAGNAKYHSTRDAKAAGEIYVKLVRTYPKSEYAEVAAFHRAVALQAEKHFDEARRAYDEFMRVFPRSKFARLIKGYKLPNLEKAEKAERARSRGEKAARR
jgi:tetratricopeptide (TPR) repeat protein